MFDIVSKVKSESNITWVEQSSYSPVSALSDFCYPKLKGISKGTHFEGIMVIKKQQRRIYGES